MFINAKGMVSTSGYDCTNPHSCLAEGVSSMACVKKYSQRGSRLNCKERGAGTKQDQGLWWLLAPGSIFCDCCLHQPLTWTGVAPLLPSILCSLILVYRLQPEQWLRNIILETSPMGWLCCQLWPSLPFLPHLPHIAHQLCICLESSCSFPALTSQRLSSLGSQTELFHSPT